MDYCYVDYPSIIKASGKNGFSGGSTKPSTPTAKPVTPTAPSKPSTTTTLKAGTKVTLKNDKIYASATSSSASATKSGTYYIYSSDVTNKRIRITNSASNVGKTPAGSYVTGWVNVSDIG